MTIPSPLHELLEQFEMEHVVEYDGVQREGASIGEFKTQLLSEFLPWGESGSSVLATSGYVELEYASIQKSTGIFDASCRGTIQLTGEDRLECINRLSTQQLLDMNEGESRLAFITSRLGSIIADAIIHVLQDRILVDVDITVVNQVCEHISSYIVMEEVDVQDVTDMTHWLWCLGPDTKMCGEGNVFTLPNTFLGIKGIAICLSRDSVEDVWKNYVEQGVKPIGWYALNMARVERGAPVFMIDFDSNALPHETSLTASRVSFNKGCYLGQEVVARMESLGQPKQRLMQLQMDSEELPIASAQLWDDNKAGSGTPIGVVTSSAISPLRGGVPTAIAMIGKKHANPNTKTYLFVGPETLSANLTELLLISNDEIS